MKNEFSDSRKAALGLLEFISKSPSPFHAVHTIEEELKNEGFERLSETQSWSLKRGGKYYVVRNGSSLAAFTLPGDEKPLRFQMICSHTDSPSFKIKENFELQPDACYRRLNVEKYGGMILSSWLDRPLSVAGRILTEENGKLVSRLICVDRDLLMIPNLAIHMNREINDGFRYQVQQDLSPFLRKREKKIFLTFFPRRQEFQKTPSLERICFFTTVRKAFSWGKARNLSQDQDWTI